MDNRTIEERRRDREKYNEIVYRKNAMIIFTKAPISNNVKTRLGPQLSKDERASLQRLFLVNILEQIKLDVDVFICYDSEKGALANLEAIFGSGCIYFVQEGEDLGERMRDAFDKTFKWGYEKLLLIGTDVPEFTTEIFREAFNILNHKDFVFTPSPDGGYSLVGMKKRADEIFTLDEYSHCNVLKETLIKIKESGKTYGLTEELKDIDVYDDLMGYLQRMEDKGKENNISSFVKGLKKISIIVPIYNEEKTIEGLIEQLEPVKGAVEIIFVDGGSTDNSLSLIPDDYKLLKAGKGRALQMNAGAMESTGDILFFLHADSVLPEDFLDEIKKANKASRVGAFGVKYDSPNFFMHTTRWISNWRTSLFGIVFGDQGMFIDRDLFFDMGMFKEIPIMEDVEFSERLRARGIKVRLTSDRILTSDRRFPKGTVAKLKFMWKMNRLRKMYRDGVDLDKISNMYRDER
ncbi:MAG: DUF2064 domain-containing protein [Tissierellia bacterium]|nr:DUF2064 domain-containing protein [Tissierellia bacterium]